tara:strand:- start:160620 stop:161372 length:753 start_codon:yes stop_codon:yes gene_type:complete
MSQPQKFASARPGTILDENSLWLQGQVANNPTTTHSGNPKKPAMKVSVKDNQVEMTVFTNDAGDTKNKGMITVLMPMGDFDTILGYVGDVSAGRLPNAFMVHSGKVWTREGLTDKPIELARTKVEIDDHGLFIQIGARNRPQPKFYLVPSEGMKLGTIENGQERPLNPVEIARVLGPKYSQRMSALIQLVAHDNYESWQDRKKRKEAAKHGGGGNQWGGQKQGGANQWGGQQQSKPTPPPSNDFDDDLPF